MLADIDLDQIVFETCQEIGPARVGWHPDEVQYVRDHLSEMGFEGVASALGRSVAAVKVLQIRAMIPAPSKRPGYLTGQQAALRLGIDIHTVTKLVDAGNLPATRIPGKRMILQISLLRLYMWAINPMHWMYFKPRRFRDQKLKRLVLLAQSRWNDRWLRVGEAEKLLGLRPHAINQRIHRGFYPRHDMVHWGNWWIRRSAIERTVIQPCRSFPDGLNWRSQRLDDFLRRAYSQGLSYEAIGRMAKISSFQVVYRLAQMGVVDTPAYIRRVHGQ